MKIAICSGTFDRREELDNECINHLPRIGERINIWYKPMPTVTDIVWDFKNDEVVIMID